METYGWDVIYACSGTYINTQLARCRDQYIQAFEYEDNIVKLSGQFGVWKLVPGGSGGLLQFECPINQGSLLIKEQSQTISLNDLVPLVQMQLTLIRGPSQDIAHRLVFHCTSVGKQKGDQTPGAITVIDPDVSGSLQKQKNGTLIAGILATALAQCFVRNASQLSYVFADVLPIPKGVNSAWLTPQSPTYCYQQPNDGSLGGLAVLGLLSDASSAPLPRTFDATLLVNGDFGFVLSAGQFMKNVILPTLPATMHGNARVDDFRVNIGQATITLAKNFNLNSVKVGAIYYTPEVTSLQFQIEDTFMRCQVATKTDITGLASAYVMNSVSSRNPSAFDITTRTLCFEKDPHVVTTQNTHIPWWESVVGALTLGIMNVVIESISLAIEDAVSGVDASTTASHFGQVAPGLVNWSGQENIAITHGGLEDNIYMQGTLKTS